MQCIRIFRFYRMVHCVEVVNFWLSGTKQMF
nr:MAG TPA: hypothetical protein [Caudoviricetes sp.]